MTNNVKNQPDHELIQSGKKMFYEETFGNEVFYRYYGSV